MSDQQEKNQESVQYVMMVTQMVAVQAIYPQLQEGQSISLTNSENQEFQPISGIPMGQVPSEQVVDPQKKDDEIPNPNLNQQNLDAYRKNVTYYVLIYLFLFIPCLILQYPLYGSIVAAKFWIASYVILIVTLALFYVKQAQYFIWNVRGQMILLSVSLLLELIACGVAVCHPVLFDYFQDSKFENYTLRTLLSNYSYDECRELYDSMSFTEYEEFYGQECDAVLNTDQSEAVYCSGYYGVYAGDYPDNVCSGYYDPYVNYCFPLQIGILVYEILNFIFYLILYVILIRRMHSLYIILSKQHTTQVGITQQAQQ